MKRQCGTILIYGLLALAILSVLSVISYSIYQAGVTAEKGRWETTMREAKEKEESRVNIISTQLENTKIAREKQARTVARLQRELSDRKGTAVVDSGLCVLSVAAIGLHNLAAVGKGESPGESDGSASGIGVDTLAETCQTNYEKYHQVADRLRALQEFAKQPPQPK